VSISADEKASAYEFLNVLRDSLNENLPPPDTLKSEFDAIWMNPNKAEREKLESKENIAFYKIAAPRIFETAKEAANLTEAEARAAFRCVYFNKFPELSNANVRRRPGHPFPKKLGVPPEKIYESWLKPYSDTFPANQAWPEAGLCAPFPHKIVFEAKYFDKGGCAAAQSQLVTAIYETVYYRGLPACNGWAYDFGCLVAFDVSPAGDLKAAWDALP